MVDERTEALIHAVIDGEADAEATVQLESALDADPQARAAMDELKTLSDRLDQMPVLEPPLHLCRVLRGDPPERPDGPLIKILTVLAGAKALRYGYSFAAGVLVTVLALQLGGAPTVVGDEMVGTMTPVEAGHSLVLGSTEMGIRITHNDGLVQVHLEVDADQPVEFEAIFGEDQVRVASFSSERGPTPTLEVRPGRLAATVSGSQHYTLVLDPIGEAPTLIMTLRAPGGAAAQQVFQLREHR